MQKMGGYLVSDGGFDPDGMITRSREEENLFGIIVDPITGQYVSYPAVPKSNYFRKMEDDFSKKVEQPGNFPGKQVNSPEKQEPLFTTFCPLSVTAVFACPRFIFVFMPVFSFVFMLLSQSFVIF